MPRPEMREKVFEHFKEGGSIGFPWTKLGKDKEQKYLVDKLLASSSRGRARRW